jgi:acyl carrier protein
VSNDPATVRQTVSDFLVRVKKGRDELPDDLALFGDGLALDSLEAAELSVVLEDAYGRDPFSAGGDLPETVGDVLAFYEVARTP